MLKDLDVATGAKKQTKETKQKIMNCDLFAV